MQDWLKELALGQDTLERIVRCGLDTAERIAAAHCAADIALEARIEYADAKKLREGAEREQARLKELESREANRQATERDTRNRTRVAGRPSIYERMNELHRRRR